MQHLSLLLEISLEKYLVSFFFSLAKYNGSSVSATVHIDDI